MSEELDEMAAMQEAGDICARKHGGADTSVAAYRVASKRENERALEVFNAIKAKGAEGLHSEDAAKLLGMRYTTVSPIFTILRLTGQIAKSYRKPTTSGCMAWVHVTTCEQFTTIDKIPVGV